MFCCVFCLIFLRIFGAIFKCGSPAGSPGVLTTSVRPHLRPTPLAQRRDFRRKPRETADWVRSPFRDGETTKIKFALLGGGGVAWGQRGKSKNAVSFFSRGKRHDNKISKVQILLSRNFVVIAQAPSPRPLEQQPLSSKRAKRTSHRCVSLPLKICQLTRDHGKGGLSLRGVAVMTEIAMTAETARTVKTATVASLCCIL